MFIITSVNTLLKDGTHFIITVLENIIILRLLVNVVFATGVPSAFTNVKKMGLSEELSEFKLCSVIGCHI